MTLWKKWGAGAALFTALTTCHAQILIGQTAGFTGQVAAGVREVTDGAKLYIDAINAKGGVHGQTIELVSLDDKFDTKLAGENARQLIEDRGVIAMFLTRGTPHTQAVIPHLDKHGVPLVAPSTGAMVLHSPAPKHIFNVRATYQREAEKAMLHVTTLGVSRVALVYVDDVFGADGIAGAQKGLAASKLQPVVLEKFDRLKPDFDPIVRKIVEAKAQSILMVASSAAVAEAVAKLRQAGSTAQLITLSNNASSGFINSLGKNASGVVVTQVFPNERAMNYGLIKEAQEIAKARGVQEISPAILEGFAGAKVLVEGLRQAGPKPTRAKLQAALEGIRKFDLGGLEVTYGPGDHTGLDFADLSIIGSSGKFRR